jgi:hypothetical protein
MDQQRQRSFCHRHLPFTGELRPWPYPGAVSSTNIFP